MSSSKTQTFDPVYSAEDREIILAAFEAKPGFNAERFLHELECHAIYYRHLSAALKHQPEIAPSTLLRNWSGLAKKLASAEKALGAAHEAVTTMITNVRRLADLEAAAADCAERDGKMPGFAPWKFELPPLPHQTDSDKGDEVLVWPTNEKITQVVADLVWLHQVVEQAQKRTAWIKTTRERFDPNAPSEKAARRRPGGKAAGRRPDDALHRFVQVIDDLYRANALDPANPRTADRMQDDNTKIGDLIDLLNACLEPLGVVRDSTALYSLWRSATGRP